MVKLWSGLLLVGAVVRSGSKILVVRERDGQGGERWGLPGGRVEQMELLQEAVAREVLEETGISVERCGPLQFLSQHREQGRPATALLLVFEVLEWSGSLSPQDPDGLVIEAVFVEVDEAIQRLELGSFAPGIRPFVRFLAAGPVSSGATSWFWEINDGVACPVAVN